MRLILLVILMLVLPLAHAIDKPYNDPKFCGFVPRTATGDIKRSSHELALFQKNNPCPSTGLTTGACPGWAKNHIWPIACGGCDKAETNMQWLPNQTKSCNLDSCVDRFERKIRYVKGPMPGFDPASCKAALIPPIVILSPVKSISLP